MPSCPQRCFVAILIFLTCVRCGEEERQFGDTTPPSPIVDLVVARPLGDRITVAWTATGDDSVAGHATYYDLRFSENPITEATWPRATRVDPSPRPYPPGVFQGCPVRGLRPSTLYYFAARVGDEARNWSLLSNVGSGITAGYTDSIPPAMINDLAVDSSSSFTISISWTAPGDDSLVGTASVYDARFSVSPIESDIDWEYSARLAGEPLPAPSGTRQSMTITGLTPDRQFYFAVRAGDEIINWSTLSPHVPAKTIAPERIPPHAITDLRVGLVTLNSVELIWTAPGDDDTTGRASMYDVRFNFYPITEETWRSCFYVLREPEPGPSGAVQSMTVTGLYMYRYYLFAIKAADEIPNWSALSNVVSVVTNGGSQDTIAPGRITDLNVIDATTHTITLGWTAPGGDGDAVIYDIRYATDSITPETWATATQVEDEIPPQAPGTLQLMDVPGLQANTLYFFAMRTSDEILNWSVLSNVASGTTKP